MDSVILFDCEFMTQAGALGRVWFGADDPDPQVVQIGAVKLAVRPKVEIADTLRLHVVPRSRMGGRLALDPYFTELTGVTEEMVDAEGLALHEAWARLAHFAGSARFWAWGKDELYLMAVSGYVVGVAPTIPATRFGNLRQLALRAGMPPADVAATGSGTFGDYFGVGAPGARRHDALDDAMSLALGVQHLLWEDRLCAADLLGET